MDRFIKTIIPMTVTALVSHLLWAMLLDYLFISVAYSLVGDRGMLWVNIIQIILTLVGQVGAVMIVWRVRKPVNAVERRAYLQELEGNVYDRKADRELVARDKTFRTELWVYALLAYIQLTLELNFILAAILTPIGMVAFYFYNRRLWTRIHEAWAHERIRLNPEKET